jgi:hypothetical protein
MSALRVAVRSSVTVTLTAPKQYLSTFTDIFRKDKSIAKVSEKFKKVIRHTTKFTVAGLHRVNTGGSKSKG